MKKSVSLIAVFAFFMVVGLGSVVSADSTMPGSYYQQGTSGTMGVGQTMMQMGASQRALTDATNMRSRANHARNVRTGPNIAYQFGSSQTDQSWKAARTIEDAGVVVGLVPGDCRGDNTSDWYRKTMGQNRAGYMKEPTVSQADCANYHPTVK